MNRTIIEFLADESGATAIEYATIAALVSVGIVGSIDILGQTVDGSMTSVAADLETAAKVVR
jgi:pilus assembly protein Flp/PilA